MARFCRQCETALSDSASFCPNCGAIGYSVKAPTPPRTPPPIVSASRDTIVRTSQHPVVWFRRSDATSKAYVFGACILCLLVAVIFIANMRSKQTPAVIVDGPAYLASVPYPSSSYATTLAEHTGDPPEDHELHLVPNLFGRGAVSDGRTYSVALITAYTGHIPPASSLIVQGVYYAQFERMMILEDEQEKGQYLMCAMSTSEFEDATYYYHKGDRVRAMGDYHEESGMNLGLGFGLARVLRGCTVSGPGEKVVRPLHVEPAASPPPNAPEPDASGPSANAP